MEKSFLYFLRSLAQSLHRNRISDSDIITILVIIVIIAIVIIYFRKRTDKKRDIPSIGNRSTITKQSENISKSADIKETINSKITEKKGTIKKKGNTETISNKNEDLHVSVSEKKKALESTIILSASDLAGEVISLIDGGFRPIIDLQKELKHPAVYMEIIFLFINELMNTAPQYLDEEDNNLFVGVTYKKIGTVLAEKYYSKNDTEKFTTYYETTFKERRMEYKNFAGLNPVSWKEDLLYLSFGKKISDILGKTFNLENDANIQNLYVVSISPIPLVKEHIESIKDLKKKYL